MRGKRPLMAGIAVGSFCMTRRCSGLKRLLILTAIFAHWLVVLPGAHAHDDYDASPARSHHRRIEDHHRHARDHWNENIAKPIEDFANDVADLFKDNKDSPSPSPVTGVDERCPWIGQGVVGAARANPLTKALIESTRMSHPFGPGARDERFEVQAEAAANGGGSEKNVGRKFGWKDAVILAATVKIDQSAANTWLPKPVLNISDVDEAIVFIAWYPDSFCCGAYHEAALLLKVTVDGRRALHCPWMLVDSDTSMIAGREILGFPKKMGEFTFEVKPPSPSDTVSDNGVGTEPMDVAAKEFDPVKSFEPGSRVTASVSRNGATVMSISGVVGALEPTDPSSGDVRTIMPRQRNVFLNAQTSHPLPPDDDDAACLGNRPKILRFAFDEVPTGDLWTVTDTEVTVQSTKTDPLGVPFGFGKEESSGSSGRSVAVVDSVVGVTSFFTGEEPMPRLFESIPQGWLEDDDIYWLRYQ